MRVTYVIFARKFDRCNAWFHIGVAEVEHRRCLRDVCCAENLGTSAVRRPGS